MYRVISTVTSALLISLLTMAPPAMAAASPVTPDINNFSTNERTVRPDKSALARSQTLIAQATSPQTFPAKRNERFDVNDISFLWPVPTSAADVDALIPADEITADGTSQFWPRSVFRTVIQKAQTVTVDDSLGSPHPISFGNDANAFRQASTWKVAAVRIDPSAPGSSEKLTQQFGATPQIRLILQPVTVDPLGKVEVHDYTTHLVYNFTKAPPENPGPDKEAFKEIVTDLQKLKQELAVNGVSTTGQKLGIHPGFKANDPAFRKNLKSFLKKHLSADRLTGVAFMGLEPPEPWIFFAMQRVSKSSFIQVPLPTLGTNTAQMLNFKGGKAVMPVPGEDSADGKSGVSTAILFDDDIQSKLQSKQSADRQSPLLKDIPDIIANPQLAHFFNTDCVSCHSESARRHDLRIPTRATRFTYKRPAGISGVDTALLPNNLWNVRNFGWFPDFFANGDTVATVTMRTANEAAESVELINKDYLEISEGGSAPRGRSRSGSSLRQFFSRIRAGFQGFRRFNS